MSVTFYIRGRDPDWESPGDEPFVNVANANAHDILAAIGTDSADLSGSSRGPVLRAACERTLAAGVHGDTMRLGVVSRGAQGALVVECGRREGYVSERIQEILELAIAAGDLGVVAWG